MVVRRKQRIAVLGWHGGGGAQLKVTLVKEKLVLTRVVQACTDTDTTTTTTTPSFCVHLLDVGLKGRIIIAMASSVISFTSMASLFCHLLLAVSCTLVVASCGEPTGRPSEVKTSNRRALATVGICIS